MKNSKLIVKTKSKTYPIYFGNNILNIAGKLIKKNLPNVKKTCMQTERQKVRILSDLGLILGPKRNPKRRNSCKKIMRKTLHAKKERE